MNIVKNLEFWASLSIIIATVFLIIADNQLLIHFGYFIGPLRANHWFVWIGTLHSFHRARNSHIETAFARQI